MWKVRAHTELFPSRPRRPVLTPNNLLGLAKLLNVPILEASTSEISSTDEIYGDRRIHPQTNDSSSTARSCSMRQALLGKRSREQRPEAANAAETVSLALVLIVRFCGSHAFLSLAVPAHWEAHVQGARASRIRTHRL
jgi:hypothetical protein